MRPTAWIAAVALSLTSLTSFAQGHEPNLPWRDLSQDRDRQVVIAAGTPDLYNGHPTTLLMDDGKTMLCTWSKGHGGDAAFLAFSYDAGLSWSIQEAPAAWKGLVNCPSIYKLTDKQGKQRIFVFAQARCENKHRDMGYSVSEDGGLTWSPVKKLGKPCIMAFTSIIRLDNGDYLGMYHTGSPEPDHDASPLRLWQAVSHDGGLTWDPSELVGEFPGRSPCEPCVFRSPDGKKLVCIARENQRVGNSLMMTSDDEGKTWTPMYECPWGLTGDRHMIRYLPDGRLIAVFRDMAPHSPTKGNFVAWVGTYQDALRIFAGQYRVKLLHSYAGPDCGYPGLEILPDGTLVATTYIKYHPGTEKHSVVSVRFKAEDLDALFR